jgi:hypothetical protein
MNDDPTNLASAYLDGELTTDERARVEDDAQLLAEVDRLRAVRLLLADVEPPAISRREAHLAAALDVWDRLPLAEQTGVRRDATPSGVDGAAIAGAASVTAPTPIGNRRRPAPTRWLTGAAAAMVLVLAGGIALQLGASDEDDSGTTSDVADGAQSAELESSDALAARESADDSAGDDASDGGSDDATLAPAGETTDATDALAADVDTGVADPAPSGDVGGLDQLLNTTDLADFAAAAVGAPVAPDATSADDENLAEESAESTTAEFARCLGVDVIVGPAAYRDVVVVVGIDESRDLAIAYVGDTCAEVARVRLP